MSQETHFLKEIGAQKIVTFVNGLLRAEDINLVAAAWDWGQLKIFTPHNRLTLLSNDRVIKADFNTEELELAATGIKPAMEAKLRALASRFHPSQAH